MIKILWNKNLRIRSPMNSKFYQNGILQIKREILNNWKVGYLEQVWLLIKTILIISVFFTIF